MSIYIVTGKLGNGKTLASVGRITDYLKQGRNIATNLDLYLEHYENPRHKTGKIYRIPDKPTAKDLEAIGRGHDEDTYNENKNGLLVLDECGTWFNSRSWNDKERRPVIDWFLHSRKLGWDVILIVQDISILDKQARDTLAEYTVFTRRLDNMNIPLITPLLKLLTGKRITMPRAHIGIVKYGDNATYPTVDRWWYRGSSLFKLYDTRQIFTPDNDGVYSYLTPWHIKGRYMNNRRLMDYILAIANVMLFIPAVLTVVAIATVSGRSPDTVASELRLNRFPLSKKHAKPKVNPLRSVVHVSPLAEPGFVCGAHAERARPRAL